MINALAAEHRDQSDLVKKCRPGRRRRSKGKQERGTAAPDKPPVLGMIKRGGRLVLQLCDNVQQRTIQPHILTNIEAGNVINTDEYAIYTRLSTWGFEHVTVSHSDGESAHNDDNDGVNEVHVNTIEGV